MNYPLNAWQWAGRELLCLIEGHNWKNSIKWKPNKDELMELESLPYILEATDVGNPYLYQAGKWRYKCRRCRLQSREDWRPLQVQFVAGISQAVWAAKCIVRNLFMDEPLGPFWKRAVAIVPLLIVAIVQGVYLHFDHAPGFVLNLTCEAEYWMYCWIDKDEKEGQPLA